MQQLPLSTTPIPLPTHATAAVIDPPKTEGDLPSFDAVFDLLTADDSPPQDQNLAEKAPASDDAAVPKNTEEPEAALASTVDVDVRGKQQANSTDLTTDAPLQKVAHPRTTEPKGPEPLEFDQMASAGIARRQAPQRSEQTAPELPAPQQAAPPPDAPHLPATKAMVAPLPKPEFGQQVQVAIPEKHTAIPAAVSPGPTAPATPLVHAKAHNPTVNVPAVATKMELAPRISVNAASNAPERAVLPNATASAAAPKPIPMPSDIQGLMRTTETTATKQPSIPHLTADAEQLHRKLPFGHQSPPTSDVPLPAPQTVLTPVPKTPADSAMVALPKAATPAAIETAVHTVQAHSGRFNVTVMPQTPAANAAQSLASFATTPKADLPRQARFETRREAQPAQVMVAQPQQTTATATPLMAATPWTPAPLVDSQKIEMSDLRLSDLGTSSLRTETAPTTVPQTAATARSEMIPHLARQLAEALPHTPNRPVEITLSPEELGRVRLSLTMSETQVTVNLLAERPETLDLLRRHIDLLGQEFRDLGFENIAFAFGDDSAETAADAQAQDTGDGPPQHQDDAEAAPVISLQSGASSGLDLRL